MMQCIHSQDTLATNSLRIIPGDTNLSAGLGRVSCVLSTERLRCEVAALQLSQNCIEQKGTLNRLSAEIANTVWSFSTAQDILTTFTKTVCSYLCWPLAGKWGNMSLAISAVLQSFSSCFLIPIATSVIFILLLKPCKRAQRFWKYVLLGGEEHNSKYKMLERVWSWKASLPVRPQAAVVKQLSDPDFTAIWWHW